MNTTPPVIPRALPLALGALLLLVLLGTASVRLSGVSVRAPDAGAVQTRSLRFEDTADGSVAVIDGRSGKLLDTLRGEQGFVRGALRALARERRLHAKGPQGPQAPFELIARADGRLTLADTATGARLDLESFGPTNAGVFARLLTL